MPETACLHIRANATDPVRVVEIPGLSVRIGRASYCEVRLAEPDLAEEECRLRRQGGAWQLVPGRSSGPVWLEGRAVESPCPLPFDVPFQVGEHWLTLRPAGDSLVEWPSYRAPASSALSSSETLLEGHRIEPSPIRNGPGTPERPATAPPPRDDQDDRLSRWQVLQQQQRSNRLKVSQEERRWEERWRAAGERLRSRGPSPPPATPVSPIVPGANRAVSEPLARPALRGRPELPDREAARPVRSVELPRATPPTRPPSATRVDAPFVAASSFSAPSAPSPALVPAQPPPGPKALGLPEWGASPLPVPMVPAAVPPGTPVDLPVAPDVDAGATAGIPMAEVSVSPAPATSIEEDVPGARAEVLSPAGERREPVAPVADGSAPVEDATSGPSLLDRPEDSPAPVAEIGEWPEPVGFVADPPPAHSRGRPASSSVVERPTIEGMDTALRPSRPTGPGSTSASSPRGGGWADPEGPAPCREWPSAREIFAAHLRAAAREPARGPRAVPSRKIHSQPVPTVMRPPGEWSLPFWLGWPPLATAAVAVGAAVLLMSWTWALDAQSAGVVAGALSRTDPEAKPLPRTVQPPGNSWWKSSAANLALWAAYFDRRSAADPVEAERARAFLDAALRASPLSATARYDKARLPRGGDDTNPPAPRLGLSRDVLALAWEGHQWLKAGRKDAALKAYREALAMAARAEPARLAPPAFLEDPQVRRYQLPGEELTGAVIRDMAEQGEWSYSEWAEALPPFALAHLQAARQLRERSSPDAEKALEAALIHAETLPPPDVPAALHLAAQAELLALKSRWEQADERYLRAIGLMPIDGIRRSWWMNVADLALRVGDDSKRQRALESARGTEVNDEVARRASDQLKYTGDREDRPALRR